jgi:hypothetical protein
MFISWSIVYIFLNCFTPFNLSNADLYIIILLRRIIEYNKGNLSVTK